MNWRTAFLASLVGTVGWSIVPAAWACPFCSAVSQTLTERIKTSDVAVLAELVEAPPHTDDAPQPISDEAIEAIKSTFRIVKVYHGQGFVQPGDTFKALYYGKGMPGAQVLIIGLEPKAIQWGLPVELSSRAVTYLESTLKLPERGPDRLDFFEDHLQDADPLLQEDSLNEFAQADYPEIVKLKSRLDRARLIRWIQDPKIAEGRRRLYFTLLGVCGTKDDARMLETMIRSGDPIEMRGLDSLLACYLTLSGPQGMPLVEKLFLKDTRVEFAQTYAAVMAIRFHGQQADSIPVQRAVEALRLMLDRPQLADLVIPDLARWEDWDSIDRLVELFKTSTEEWRHIRVPIINFLRACPRPEAKAKLEELAKLDPDSFKRASTYFPFGGVPAAAKPGAKKQPPAKPAEEKPTQAKPGDAESARRRAPSSLRPAVVPGQGPMVAAAEEPSAADDQAASHDSTPAQRSAIERPVPTPGAVIETDRRTSDGMLTLWLIVVPALAAVLLFAGLWLVLRAPMRKRLQPPR